MSIHCFLLRKLYNILFKEGEISKERRNELQRSYISEYGVKARHFKSLYIEVKGMITSQRELIKTNIETTKSLIKKQKKKLIKKPNSVKDIRRNIKVKTKLNRLNQRLENIDDIKPVVFGTRKFYKKQFTDEKYISDHELWLKEWREARDGHLYLVGSSDEGQGNSLCQIINPENIQLTIPSMIKQKFSMKGNHLNLDVAFYSTNDIKNKRYLYLKQALDNEQPITYRIIKKNSKYYIQASFSISVNTREVNYGTVGVDLNHEMLALCTVKTDGNPIDFHCLDYDMSKSTEQIEQDLSKICDDIIAIAEKNHMSITLENLDLEKTKHEMNTRKTTNNKVHSIPYKKIRDLLYSKCLRKGIELKIVNPAYTSIAGKFKYSRKLGRSVHESAALCIGRRGLGFKEKVPCILYSILHSGERGKHHWRHWSLLSKEAKSFLKGDSLYNLNLGSMSEHTTASLSHLFRSGDVVKKHKKKSVKGLLDFSLVS